MGKVYVYFMPLVSGPCMSDQFGVQPTFIRSECTNSVYLTKMPTISWHVIFHNCSPNYQAKEKFWIEPISSPLQGPTPDTTPTLCSVFREDNALYTHMNWEYLRPNMQSGSSERAGVIGWWDYSPGERQCSLYLNIQINFAIQVLLRVMNENT